MLSSLQCLGHLYIPYSWLRPLMPAGGLHLCAIQMLISSVSAGWWQRGLVREMCDWGCRFASFLKKSLTCSPCSGGGCLFHHGGGRWLGWSSHYSPKHSWRLFAGCIPPSPLSYVWIWSRWSCFTLFDALTSCKILPDGLQGMLVFILVFYFILFSALICGWFRQG